MKILVIPEDQTHDQYIAKPVIEAVVDHVGLVATVTVLPEPRLRGTNQVLDPELIMQIVEDNAMIDLFVLLVDRDCDRQGNTKRALAIESAHVNRLIACLPIQELEVWMLALHKDSVPASWTEVRAECDPKERFAEPFLARLGSKGPGGGRKAAMNAGLRGGGLKTLLSLCSELREFSERLTAWAAVRTSS